MRQKLEITISPSLFSQAQVESHSMVCRCESRNLTSAKTNWSGRLNLHAQLLAKPIQSEVSYVVIIQM